jgi:hypothetical protein
MVSKIERSYNPTGETAWETYRRTVVADCSGSFSWNIASPTWRNRLTEGVYMLGEAILQPGQLPANHLETLFDRTQNAISGGRIKYTFQLRRLLD